MTASPILRLEKLIPTALPSVFLSNLTVSTGSSTFISLSWFGGCPVLMLMSLSKKYAMQNTHCPYSLRSLCSSSNPSP